MDSSLNRDNNAIDTILLSELCSYREFNHARVWSNLHLDDDTRVVSLYSKLKGYKAIGIAAFFALLLASIVIMRPPGTSFQYQYLSDGSEVLLQNQSHISGVTYNNNHREVDFEGSAYFEIEADEESPFIIKHKDYQVMVVGTGFSILEKDGCHQVFVEHGRVILSDIQLSTQITLEAGSSARICDDHIESLNLDEEEVQFHPLRFKNQPISNLLQALSHNYGLKISMDKGVTNQIDNCLITTNFERISVKSILEELQILHKIKYRLDGQYLYISEYNCH